MRTEESQLDAKDPGEPLASAPRPTTLDWVMFAVGCVRRRKLASVAVFILSLAGVAAYAAKRQPVYRVEAKVLAQRSQALSSAVRPAYDDVPTRSAWEIIHRRENLLSIVKQTNLVAEWSPPAGPRFLEPFGREDRALTPEELTESLVAVLDDDLLVTSAEGTITIQFDWPDPRQAYSIVSAAVQNFLDARELQEVKAIDDVVSVLDARAAVLRREYESAVEHARRQSPTAQRTPVPRTRRPNPELITLKDLLDAKQRTLRDLEESRLRRVEDLQSQLDKARTTFSEAHPTVIGLRRDLAAASQPSPQLEALREEEKQLRLQYVARGGACRPTITRSRGRSSRWTPGTKRIKRSARRGRTTSRSWSV